jgi:hypothetical protein
MLPCPCSCLDSFLVFIRGRCGHSLSGSAALAYRAPSPVTFPPRKEPAQSLSGLVRVRLGIVSVNLLPLFFIFFSLFSFHFLYFIFFLHDGLLPAHDCPGWQPAIFYPRLLGPGLSSMPTRRSFCALRPCARVGAAVRCSSRNSRSASAASPRLASGSQLASV